MGRISGLDLQNMSFRILRLWRVWATAEVAFFLAGCGGGWWRLRRVVLGRFRRFGRVGWGMVSGDAGVRVLTVSGSCTG